MLEGITQLMNAGSTEKRQFTTYSTRTGLRVPSLTFVSMRKLPSVFMVSFTQMKPGLFFILLLMCIYLKALSFCTKFYIISRL